jgi:hypothetical protein
MALDISRLIAVLKQEVGPIPGASGGPCGRSGSV